MTVYKMLNLKRLTVHIYDFLTSLNLKLDTVCDHILEQRPLPFLMEVCFKVHLKEDCINAWVYLLLLLLTQLPLVSCPRPMIMTIIVKNQSMFVSIVRNSDTLRISVGNFIVVPQEVRNKPSTRNRT